MLFRSWAERIAPFPAEVLNSIEKSVLLQTLDKLWRHHLQALDILRKGINLRGYAQKDPLNEYARESFMLFEDLLAATKQETVSMLSRVQLAQEEPESTLSEPTQFSHPTEQGEVTEAVPPTKKAGSSPKKPQPEAAPASANNPLSPANFGVTSWDEMNPLDGRIPRNAPCPCGSGERFKACHGSLERIKSKAKQAA